MMHAGPGLPLTESLLQVTVPLDARCGRGALFSLFVGLDLALLLMWTLFWGSQHLAVQQRVVTMTYSWQAWTPQLPQLSRSAQPVRHVKILKSLQPARLWHHIQPTVYATSGDVVDGSTIGTWPGASTVAVAHASEGPPARSHAKQIMADQFYGDRFQGVRQLYGPSAPALLQTARVVVVGLGGVGSWAVEALARSGIGSLVLVDFDEICISNTNRQLHALHDTVGKSKARVLADRVTSISPNCNVTVREQCVFADSALDLLREEAKEACTRGETLSLLDAVDTSDAKEAMVLAANRLNLHIVVSGAAGGKTDPTAVRVSDLSEVKGDKLLRKLRQNLRSKHGFGSRRRGGGKFGIPCVYSQEVAKEAEGEGIPCDRYGTACFATGAFGFAAAAHLTTALARENHPLWRSSCCPPPGTNPAGGLPSNSSSAA